MAGTAFVAPSQKSPATESEQELWSVLRGLVGAFNGDTTWQRLIRITGIDDDAEYAVVVQNQGTGGHLQVPGILDVTSSGVVIGVLSVTNLTVSGTLTANGNVTLGNAAGDAITVNGVATFGTTTVFDGPILANGAVTLGNAAGDSIVVNGTASINEILTLLKGLVVDTTTLVVDAVNNRVGVGTATPAAVLDVAGRIRVTGGTAPATGAGVEFGFAAAVGTIVAFDRTGGVYQTLNLDALTLGLQTGGATRIAVAAAGLVTINNGATVAGTLTSTGGIVVSGPNNIDGNGGTAGQLRIGAVIANAASLSGSEKLRVGGSSLLEGLVTVTTGGIGVTGNSAFNNAVSVTNGPLTVPTVDPPTANGEVTAGSQAKASAHVTGSSGALGHNYNIASVTRNGAGDYSIAWDRDFTSASYAVLATVEDNAALLNIRCNSKTSSSADIHVRDAAGVLTDPDAFAVAAFGTLI